MADCATIPSSVHCCNVGFLASVWSLLPIPSVGIKFKNYWFSSWNGITLLLIKDLIHPEKPLVIAGKQLLKVPLRLRCPFHYWSPTSKNIGSVVHTPITDSFSQLHHLPTRIVAEPWYCWFTRVNKKLQTTPAGQSSQQEACKWHGNINKLLLVYINSQRETTVS